mgnify:CR=1 FL=1
MSEEKKSIDEINEEINKLQTYLDKLKNMYKRIEKQNNAIINLDNNNNTSEKFEYDLIDEMIVTIKKEISTLKENIAQEYQIESENVNEKFLQDKIKELRNSKRKKVNKNGGKSRRRSRKNKRTRKSKKKARRSKKARKTRK